jgi:ribose transport system substrate-binding protein
MNCRYRFQYLFSVGVGAAVLAVTLAACSSSSSTSSSTSSKQTSAPISASAAGSGAGGASGEASSAATELATYVKYPTQLNLPDLPSKPAPGGTVVFLHGGTPQLAQMYNGVQAAAAAVGWHAAQQTFDPENPATLVAAMKTALQSKPTAVALDGVPYALWSSEVPAYKAAGVPIIAFATGDVPIGNPVIVNLQGTPDSDLWAKMLSSWFISTSNAQGQALLVGYPDIGAFKEQTTALAADIKQGCSACKTTTLNLPIAQLATTSNPSIVSALQKSPGIKYVITAYGLPIDGLTAALKAAGLSGVQVAGSSPTLSQLQGLVQGTSSAWVANGYNVLGYLVVDSALRYAEHVNIPTGDGGQPTVLLTKANVGTPTNDTGNVPANYASLFEQLWRVG